MSLSTTPSPANRTPPHPGSRHIWIIGPRRLKKSRICKPPGCELVSLAHCVALAASTARASENGQRHRTVPRALEDHEVHGAARPQQHVPAGDGPRGPAHALPVGAAVVDLALRQQHDAARRAAVPETATRCLPAFPPVLAEPQQRPSNGGGGGAQAFLAMQWGMATKSFCLSEPPIHLPATTTTAEALCNNTHQGVAFSPQGGVSSLDAGKLGLTQKISTEAPHPTGTGPRTRWGIMETPKKPKNLTKTTISIY